jgi:hypothetical protein
MIDPDNFSPFFDELGDLEASDPGDRTLDEYPATGESGETYEVEEASMRTGSATEPFVCTICGEKFQSYLLLIEHFENGQCNAILA